jgi:hypothetical protein
MNERLDVNVKIRLSSSDWDELQRIARLEDRSTISLIRRAVRFYLTHADYPYGKGEGVTHG